MKHAFRIRSSNTLRKSFLACSVAAVLGTTAMAAVAQETEAVPQEPGVTSLEAVSVVGTRIRRKDEVAASPVFTMERSEIEATAAA